MLRALSKIYNGKSRHISLRHEYVRQLITDGVITITYVRSCKNLADPFTKALTRDLVRVLLLRWVYNPSTKLIISGNPTSILALPLS